MPRRGLERNNAVATMKSISSFANRRVGARKPENNSIRPLLCHQRPLERRIPNERLLWNNDCDSIMDLRTIDYRLPFNCREPPTEVRAKKKQEKTKTNTKKEATNKLEISRRNQSLGIKTMPVARRASTFDVASYVEKNVEAWVTEVLAKVGFHKKERRYQVALKALLLSKGFCVSCEHSQRTERQGHEDVTRRADLIFWLHSHPQKRFLMELKAKKKLDRKDIKQVCDYYQHFGNEKCFLINFRPDPEVKMYTKTSLSHN